MTQIASSPRSGLTKEQTRSTLEAFYVNAGVRAVFDVFCTPTSLLFTTFALALGIGRDNMGVVSSLLYAACALQLVAISLNRYVRDKKQFVLGLMVVEPAIMILAVLTLPFLPQGWRLPMVAMAAFVSAGTLHLSRPVMDDWVAASIPPPLRGRYVGRRTQAISVVTMVATLAAGFLAEKLSDPMHLSVLGLALALAVGAVFGMLSAIPLRSAMLPRVTQNAQADWSDLPDTFRYAPFRRFVIGILITAAPFAFSLHYYQVFAIDVLQLDKRVLAAINIGYVIIRIAVLPLIGRRLVRWGPRLTLRLSAFCYVAFFACYALTALGGVWFIALGWVIAAVGDSFWNIAQSAGMYASVPQTRSRPAYFAVCNLLIFGMYAVGGWIAVPLIHVLRDIEFSIGPYVFGQYHIYYLGCALLMVPCTLGPSLLMSQQETRDHMAREAA